MFKNGLFYYETWWSITKNNVCVPVCERDDRESLSNTVKERITKQLSQKIKEKKKSRE